MERTSQLTDVSCASQEDIGPGPGLTLQMRPLATMDMVGGGTGRMTPDIFIGKGTRGVPLAMPPASMVLDSVKKQL